MFEERRLRKHVEALDRQLSSSSLDERRGAIAGLREVAALEAVAALIRTLDHPDDETSPAAMEALAAMAPLSTAALATFVSQRGNPFTCRLGVLALQRIADPSTVGALAYLMQNPPEGYSWEEARWEEARIEAARALGIIRGTDAVAQLVVTLADKNSTIALAAAEALISAGGIDALVPVGLRSRDERARHSAAAAVTNYGVRQL